MAKNQICRNCGHNASENYCPACGQRTTVDRITWHSLLESATSTVIGDEAFGLRGINMRKGAVMTWLAILCRPFTAISEYLGGKRHKYFNPIGILLTLSSIYAIIFSLSGKEYIPKVAEGKGLIVSTIYTYMNYAAMHPAANMLLMLPFYALAMKSVFGRKSDLRYVEFLYIGIFLAIIEITLMLIGLPAEVNLRWYSSPYMLTLPLFIYSTAVFYKMFGLKKRGAILRTLLANILQYIYVAILCLLVAALIYVFSSESFKQELKTGLHKESVLNELIDGLISDDGEAGLPEEMP